MLERNFQPNVIHKIKRMFPGCYVFKSDSCQYQGMPDLLILYHGKWAALEVKQSATAKHRPNQDYRVDEINNNGGFARFIFPENEKEILDELQQALRV